MSDENEILDHMDGLDKESTYDATSQFDEGYSLDRITFKGILGFVLSVLNFEKGILFTIRELILRPKVVIEEYLKKDRKKLINPIRFLVFSTALATFLSFTFLSNNVGIDFQEGFNEGVDLSINESFAEDSINSLLKDSTIQFSDSTIRSRKQLEKEKMMKFSKDFSELMSTSNDKFTFILIIFLALFSFLFFKSTGYNFTENIVINCYMSSINNVFTILFLIPAFITGETLFVMISSVISIGFCIYYWMNVYRRRTVGGFFRCLLTYLVSYLSFSIVLGILVIIYFFFKMN